MVSTTCLGWGQYTLRYYFQRHVIYIHAHCSLRMHSNAHSSSAPLRLLESMCLGVLYMPIRSVKQHLSEQNTNNLRYDTERNRFRPARNLGHCNQQLPFRPSSCSFLPPHTLPRSVPIVYASQSRLMHLYLSTKHGSQGDKLQHAHPTATYPFRTNLLGTQCATKLGAISKPRLSSPLPLYRSRARTLSRVTGLMARPVHCSCSDQCHERHRVDGAP
jgi:hypothetical protein